MFPSGSVAAIAVPISVSAAVFSATDRVVLFPSANTGARFGMVSSISVTVIVTSIVSDSLPSETVSVTL